MIMATPALAKSMTKEMPTTWSPMVLY